MEEFLTLKENFEQDYSLFFEIMVMINLMSVHMSNFSRILATLLLSKRA